MLQIEVALLFELRRPLRPHSIVCAAERTFYFFRTVAFLAYRLFQFHSSRPRSASTFLAQ